MESSPDLVTDKNSCKSETADLYGDKLKYHNIICFLIIIAIMLVNIINIKYFQ